MVIRTLLAILLISLSSGCSGGFGTMRGIMESWEGVHVDRVLSQWGYPAEERQVIGRRILVWHVEQSVTLPPQSSLATTTYGNTVFGTATTYGGGTLHGSCDRLFEIDDRGYVIGWEWSGNNCPFAEWFQYSRWRYKEPT